MTARHIDVALRAYHIWESEGRPDGKALEHWLRAEAECAAELIAPRAPRRGAAKKTTRAAARKEPVKKPVKKPAATKPPKMPQILDTLRREHRNIASVLDVLDRQLRVFEKGEQPDYDLIGAAVEYFQGFPERCHHPKEDLVFARLRERDPQAARRIGDLASAHAEIAAKVRALADGLPAVLGDVGVPRDEFLGWARAFIDPQRQHLAMEEATFFPAAERALTRQDWTKLATTMTAEQDPLLGSHVDERFEALRRTILAWQSDDDAAARTRGGIA